MYKIEIYNLKDNYRLTPFGYKYQILLESQNAVMFTSNKRAFKFVAQLSSYLDECLEFLNFYRVKIFDKTDLLKSEKSIKSDKKKVFEFIADIQTQCIDLDIYKTQSVHPMVLIKKFYYIIELINDSLEILEAHFREAQIRLFKNFKRSFNYTITNASALFDANRLTNFQF